MFRCQVACPGSMLCCQKAAVTAGETQKVLFRAIFCACARSRFCHKAIASSHSTRQINHKESGDGGRARDKDTNRCVWRRPWRRLQKAPRPRVDWSDIDSPVRPHNGAWKCSVLVVHTREGCSFLIYLTALCLCSHMQQAIESARARASVCVELDNKFRHEILFSSCSPLCRVFHVKIIF